MFGSIFSDLIKVATLPVDIVEAVADVATGGDGSKESRKQNPANMMSEIRDGVCKAVEKIDK